MPDKPFIIAEMSGNHNHSLERALQIVGAAAKSGVDALKIQTYTQDTMTLNCDKQDFIIEDKDSLWYGEKLYDLYKKASTPYEWHKPIFDKCKELGILGFSTPFDLTSVDFLEELDCPIYKIASFENGDIPLLKRVAQTKKPVIISLGMICPEEIKEAVDTLFANGCSDLTILKCTSTYPANAENSNLLTIKDLKERFPNCKVGLSDHSMGVGVSIAAVALGATVIEKHFTLSRADGGVDSAFSMEPHEMKLLVEECNKAYLAVGKVNYELSESEKNSLKFRRSIYVSADIKKGEKITKNNVKCIRPGYGLHPRYYEAILGKAATKDLNFGTPLTKDCIDDLF